MGSRLAGKVAIVTGSTSGIGRASAELFAEEGAAVVVNGRRRELGREVVEGIRARGGTASYFYGDVTQSDSLQALVQFTLETYGRLDILMNNAYTGRSRSIMDMEMQDWDTVCAATVKAVALASRLAIPAMIKAGGGAIINTSSVQGQFATTHNAGYNTFKAALIGLTRQMAVDFGRYGIRVNVLCPGRIITESQAEYFKTRPERVSRETLLYPLRRFGTPRETAKAALFLASDDASFVTGHALVVDGGASAQLHETIFTDAELAAALAKTYGVE